MLRIRADQLKAFEEDRLHQWLAEDLRGLYPERAGSVEPQAMRATVASAVQQARDRGFQQDEQIRRYVHVAFLVGPEFETDGECEWAVKILEDPKYRTQGSRLRALHDATLRHVRNFEGQSSPVSAPAPVIKNCPVAKPPLTWIAIVLVDTEGNPLGGKRYRIQTPDEQVREGILDTSGNAREEGIEPGTCEVSFPELDEEAWERE